MGSREWCLCLFWKGSFHCHRVKHSHCHSHCYSHSFVVVVIVLVEVIFLVIVLVVVFVLAVVKVLVIGIVLVIVWHWPLVHKHIYELRWPHVFTNEMYWRARNHPTHWLEMWSQQSSYMSIYWRSLRDWGESTWYWCGEGMCYGTQAKHVYTSLIHYARNGMPPLIWTHYVT